ncbi:TetR/AcrR family transcriptional regulator [Desulfogranum mediterraneum]|uniref:TetR/AcrR family transcriptional regulator n=1 Tax=Desulfogranum mediterraneum TaxID=160661 RepID=UPI000413B3F2|nr:TetR/AcrR family transcriptional regulator [Desulfogranum mediterraneum]
MRITQEAKQQNRKRILQVAASLFSEQGYGKTTTRDISTACKMAKGTLFNYFPSKETLAMTMVAEAMEEGRERYLERRAGEESLVEELFLLVASELRALRPYRLYIGPVLESGMSVFAKEACCPAGEQARRAHLETVAAILAAHHYELVPESIAVTLYWSLYLGILAHWSKDTSSHQQATLSLLDYSMKVFAVTISGSLPEV